MKHFATLFALLIIFSSNGHAEEVSNILNNIVTVTYSNDDFMVIARLQNELIHKGTSAVDELIQALGNENLDMSARWASAQVLGEIGDTRAIPALKNILTQPKSGDTSWLKDTCKRSLDLFDHPEKRSGKIYVYHISNVCERTDPDTGLTVSCP